MMRKHSTGVPGNASDPELSVMDLADNIDDEIADLHRVRHLIEMIDELLDAPYGGDKARQRCFQAITLVGFAKERLSDVIRLLEEVSAAAARKGGAA